MAAQRLGELGEQGDLVAAFSGLPMQVMSALLGVPAASVPEFIDWVDALSPTFALMDADQIRRATNAIQPLLACVSDVVEARSQAPAEDLISALVATEDQGDTLARDETVAMAVNLLVGGHDTTASQIGCTLFTLLRHPDAIPLAANEPDLIGPIVSETLRFEPSIVGAPRTIVEPLEIGGVERQAGTAVMLATGAADRDPAVWHDADELIPRRFVEARAPRLLTFGAGIHYCLGAALARVTLEETVHVVASTRTRSPGGSG